MVKGVVALYTHDSRYANAFLNYNLCVEKEKITVKIFTNNESFLGAVHREAFDLLLIDDMCIDENMEKLEYKIAVLSRKKFISKQEYSAIFMYQKAMLVFRQVYEILAEKTVEEKFCCAAKSAMPVILGVFSPCYPLLRECMARKLAEYVGRCKKVLYLNMSKFSYKDFGDERGLGELLYFIQQESKAMIYKLNAMIVREQGYDVLPGVRHYKDIDDISKDDIVKLMKQFELIDEYDVVVIDIGLEGETAYCLMEYCSSIYMPVNEDIGYGRHKHMKNDVAKEKNNNVWEHIQEVNRPLNWYDRESEIDVWMNSHMSIWQ